MKRIIAIALVALMLAATLCACGAKKEQATVTTKVAAEYDDGYAKTFAESSSKDSDGNTVYEFNESQYEDYTKEHNNVLSGDMSKELVKEHGSEYGEFVYINEEKKAVIVGIHKDQYDEKVAKEESESLAQYGFKYFQNLKTPVDSIRVIYANANNQNEEFGSFDFSIN